MPLAWATLNLYANPYVICKYAWLTISLNDKGSTGSESAERDQQTVERPMCNVFSEGVRIHPTTSYSIFPRTGNRADYMRAARMPVRAGSSRGIAATKS